MNLRAGDKKRILKAGDKERVRKDVFFLRFTRPHLRGTDMYPTLASAKAAAWELFRSGQGQPREILDWHMQPVLGAKELREWLSLQDREWPEIEDLGDDLDFE